MSYLCICYADSDLVIAQRFCHDLTKYGFRYECISEATPMLRRHTLIDESDTLILLTSPACEKNNIFASDLRRSSTLGIPTICVSLAPNQLDERFSVDHQEDNRWAFPYPAGETDTPDERSVALFVHRLYISHLCKLSDCFTSSRCVDDAHGYIINQAVKAWSEDAEAQYATGMAYAQGKGVPTLENEAAAWIGKAARAGLPHALVRMGELLLDGEGVERDHAEALRMFSAAAKAGSAVGQYYRGICCLYGFGLMKDPEMAIRYLRSAAGMGYAPALYRLGLLYRDGVGTTANWHKAVKYLYLSACPKRNIPLYGHKFTPQANKIERRFVCISMRFLRQKLAKKWSNDPNRLQNIQGFGLKPCLWKRISFPEDAWLYQLDTSYDSSRYNKNRGYSHKRWDPALSAGALGRLLELGSPENGIKPSPVAAFLWYRRAMKHGHSGAMFRLGDAYRRGRGVPMNKQQAVRLFHRAAEFGNTRGQFAMGVCCELGDGLPVSKTEAVRWYEMAATAGYAPAQNNLGGCYEYGIGVTSDMLTAVEWYTKASAAGQPDAACRLGLCYESGRGVPQNQERAFHLFEDAARKGHPYALYRLGLCYDLGITVKPQVTYAAHLYERAARGGIADAAYAMALCYRGGRGVRKDLQLGFEWLQTAAELGSIQGCFELGLCYFEGHTTMQNKEIAVKYFLSAVKKHQQMSITSKDDNDWQLPVDCMTITQAVGGALYMLGYSAITHDPPDPSSALAYFEKAAMMERFEAMTAIGDMYTYGLLHADNIITDNEMMALKYYETAAQGYQTDALLSLAVIYEKKAQKCVLEGNTSDADMWREKAWRCLARSAERGSHYALVGMAGCAWLGHGTAKNHETAKWFLERANQRVQVYRTKQPLSIASSSTNISDSCVLAHLWLGDIYFHTLQSSKDPEQVKIQVARAEDAYLQAIRAPITASEHGVYTIPDRQKSRQALDVSAKSQAHYRLAILKMLYAENHQDVQAGFTHLATAILMGHTDATFDLARLYAKYKANLLSSQIESTSNTPQVKRSRKKERPIKNQPYKSVEFLGGSYYLDRLPCPTPFVLEMPTPPQGANIPDYVNQPVTEMQIGVALNHLGDRYFYGQGLPHDQHAAFSCYQKAAQISTPRGTDPEGGIIWAQYSLGFCLLEGLGTPKNPREAVKWLSMAAKYHKEAAFCLATCYERGIGVDHIDLYEALKFYRKAKKLGHSDTASHILRLEKCLREEE